jgi:recombination protein RecA
MTEALRRLAAGVDRTRTVLVFGNRIKTAVQGDHADETPGGRALRFYGSVRVGLSDEIRYASSSVWWAAAST